MADDSWVAGAATPEPTSDWVAGPPTPKPSDWVAGTPEAIKPRSTLERFGSNLADAAFRNPTIASMRGAYSDPTSVLPLPGTGIPAPNFLDFLGPVGLGGKLYLAAKGKADREAGEENPVLSGTEERARRAGYEKQAAADPFYTAPGGILGKAGAGAATLTGQLVGALTDPQNLVGFGKSAVQRILSNVGVNVAGDLETQGQDVKAKVQDKWIPGQTVVAGAFGAGLGAAHETARAVGEVGHALKSAIPDYTPPGPAPTAPLNNTVDALWRHLVRQESGGDQSAESPKGAKGVAQLMPDTARYVAGKVGRPDLAEIALGDGPQAAAANQYLGKIYLGEQLATFGHDPALALAAYNAGPGRVREWVSRFGHPDQIGRANFIDMIPFGETRDYVRKILGNAAGGDGRLTPDQKSASERAWFEAMQDQGHKPASDLAAWQKILGDEQPAAPEVAKPDVVGDVEKDVRARAEAFGTDLTPAGAETSLPTESAGDLPPPEHFDDFPGDREGEPVETRNSTPWDDEDVGHPEDVPPIERDLTEQALDHMRSGKAPKEGIGPTLIEALVKEGGVRDEGGELTGILGGQGQDRLLKMLRRVKAGKTLDDAALWAQQRGFIGGNLDEGHPRVTPQDLLDAIREEVAGKPRHADIDHDARMVNEHIADLEPFLHEIGVDPRTHTNGEIRAAMDRYFNGGGHEEMEPGSMGLKAEEPGAAASRERAERISRRDAIYASTKGSLRAERKAGAVPAGAGDLPPVEASFADIWRNLKEALGVPVRQGRLGMRKALGTYNRLSGVVRVSGVHDVGVEAHELAHAMEFTKKYPTLLAEMAAHATTLKPLDYDLKAKRRHEGFAEWVRWYVTNPNYARQVAPLFYDAFERAMGTDDPKALAALQAAQRQYSEFLASPSLASASRSIVRRQDVSTARSFVNIMKARGLPEAAGMAWREASNEIYRGIVDHLHPWKKAVEALQDIAATNGGVAHLIATADPYKILRQVPAVYAAGQMDLMHGVHPYHRLDPDSPSLAEALELALGKQFLNWDTKPGGIASEFDAYLISRRVRHDYDRMGQPGGLSQPPDQYSRAYHDQVVADAEARHPQWADAADMIYEWNNALWQKRFDAGFLTPDAYREGLENNPDYVPLYRDVSDTQSSPGGKRGNGTKSAGGARRRKGSTRAYMSPVESMMQNAYELNALIARNDALRALDDMGQLFGADAGRIVERLPARETKSIKVGVDEVLDNAARDIGLSPTDQAIVKQTIGAMFGEDASTKIYRGEDARERGEPILYVWRDGEKIPLRLPDGKWGHDMVEAFAGMTPPMRGLMFEIAAIPARLLRIGTTAHPNFFFPNTIRDQFTATLLTDVGYRPFYDQARGIAHEIGQSDLTRHYNVVGGEIGGMQSAAEREGRLKADINVLRRNFGKVRHFADWAAVARVVELSETGTRLGLFERGVDKFKKEGLSDYDAAKESAFEARDYMDFDRHGGWPGVRAAMRLIPFANASTQALDKALRVASGLGQRNNWATSLFGRPPATRDEQAKFDNALKLWIGMTTLATASLAWRAQMKDNPEFDEVSDYIRNTAWAFPGPFGYGIVPKPYELAAMSNAVERAFEAVTLHDPTAWKRLAEGLETQLTPNHDAPIMSIPFQLAANKDTFGSPIVPDQLQNVDPQFQYTDRTSNFGKMVGKITADLPFKSWHQSPAKVDFVVKSLFSSAGRDALALTKSGTAPIETALSDMPIVNRFVKDWTRGARSSKEFYSKVSGTTGEWTAGVNSFQKLVNDGDAVGAVKYLQDMEPAKRAYVTLQVLGEGGDKDIHPMVRAQKISNVLQSMAFEIQQGNLTVVGPQGLQEVKVSPHERRVAVDALHRMAVAEQRNAMIASGLEGWRQRVPLAYDKYAMQLQSASPQLSVVMQQRLALKDPHIQPATQTYATWKVLAPALENLPPAAVMTAVITASQKGKAGALRMLEKPVPVH